MSSNRGYTSDNYNNDYSNQPARGEFPAIGSTWTNSMLIGDNNHIACPERLDPGYLVSDRTKGYDNEYPLVIDDVVNYYVVTNNKNPIDPESAVTVNLMLGDMHSVVSRDEPYNNPRADYMRQIFDYDDEYCSSLYPHNTHPVPELGHCGPAQQTLNWFKTNLPY